MRGRLNSLLGLSLCPWRERQASEHVVKKKMSVCADARWMVGELINFLEFLRLFCLREWGGETDKTVGADAIR